MEGPNEREGERAEGERSRPTEARAGEAVGMIRAGGGEESHRKLTAVSMEWCLTVSAPPLRVLSAVARRTMGWRAAPQRTDGCGSHRQCVSCGKEEEEAKVYLDSIGRVLVVAVSRVIGLKEDVGV